MGSTFMLHSLNKNVQCPGTSARVPPWSAHLSELKFSKGILDETFPLLSFLVRILKV